MIRIDYKDFYQRRTSLGKIGLKAVPESRDVFLRRVGEFLSNGRRKVINIETNEDRVRVWFQEDV